MCVCVCVCVCTCGVHTASSERCVLLLPRHSAAPVAVAIATGGGLGYGAGAWGGLGLYGGRGSAAAAAVAVAAVAACSAGVVSCGTTKTAISTCHRTCKKLVIFQTAPSSSRVRPFLKSAVEPMHTDAPRLTCVLSREPGATNEEDASANESIIYLSADGASSLGEGCNSSGRLTVTANVHAKQDYLRNSRSFGQQRQWARTPTRRAGVVPQRKTHE